MEIAWVDLGKSPLALPEPCRDRTQGFVYTVRGSEPYRVGII